MIPTRPCTSNFAKWCLTPTLSPLLQHTSTQLAFFHYKYAQKGRKKDYEADYDSNFVAWVILTACYCGTQRGFATILRLFQF